MEDKKFVPIHRHPDGSSRFVRIEEKDLMPLFLRQRSTLAYLYFNELLRPQPYTGISLAIKSLRDEGQLWAPDQSVEAIEDMYHTLIETRRTQVLWKTIDDAEVVGGTVICTDRTASWREQFPGLFLRHGSTPEDLINSFTPAMQWLKDRPNTMRVLDGMWKVHA